MQEFSFGIIPVRRNGDKYQFLLIHRLEGFWELPKGHAEGDEDDIQAAIREFSEETGIDAVEVVKDSVFENKYYYRRDNELVQKTVKYFLGIVPPEAEVRVQKEEVDNYRWADPEDALGIVTHKNSKELLEKVCEHLNT